MITVVALGTCLILSKLNKKVGMIHKHHNSHAGIHSPFASIYNIYYA